MTSLTPSLISSDTMSSNYIMPTPSLTQYKSVVQNIYSLKNTSLIRTNIASIIRPSSQQARSSVNSSTQSSSVAILSLSDDISVSLSSTSSLSVQDLSVYSDISSQFSESSIATKQRIPLSSFFISELAQSSSTLGTFHTKPAQSIIITSASHTVSHTASIHLVKPNMVIKPPPLVPVTTPTMTSSLHMCTTGNCCTHALSQLPGRLDFKESENKGMQYKCNQL